LWELEDLVARRVARRETVQRSFQVRAKSNAFGQGDVTAYKVTKLCGKEIN